jgi:hypothetical protein
MRSKKRVLVTAFGATVALTLQTPVSAFIVSSRKAAVATAVAHHNPPSYLADAFSDAGRRVLGADRWNGWRAGAADSVADDLDSAPVQQARVDSTLGGLDLGYLGAGTADQGRNGSIAPASGDSPTANASVIGGGGSGGGGGAGGIGGAGGGGGGAGAGGVDAAGGADGLGAGEASGSLLASAAGNAGSNGLVAGEFGTLPGVSAGRLNSPFPAGPTVLMITDPASGAQVPNPLAVESPEPGTLLFLGAGLAGLAARRARRNRPGRG